MFETWFKNISVAKANYQNAKTEEEKGDARLVYQTISGQIKETDKITQRAFSDYESSRACGNPLLDIREVLWNKDVPAYVESLRSHGVQMFTVSSTYSSAVELYWELEKAGCHMVGMREVFLPFTKGPFGDELEKAPAVLFSLY